VCIIALRLGFDPGILWGIQDMARQAKKVAGVYEKNPGSGIFYIRYRVKGKLVRKMIGDRQDALDQLNKVKFIKSSGEGVVPSTAKMPILTLTQKEKVLGLITLGELCDGLLKQIAADPEQYRDQHNPPIRIGRIKAAFGTRPAVSIRPFEISDWLNSLKTPSGARLSAGSRNRYKTVFSSIYSYGKGRELVAANPVKEFKSVREGAGVIRYLGDDEEKRLRAVLQRDVDACGPKNARLKNRKLHHAYELDVAVGTGMRRGEQYGLTWDDVNFERRTISLHKTKNGSGRVVRMNDDVLAALEGLRDIPMVRKNRSADQPNEAPENAVFSLGDNKKWFADACDRAKIKEMRWHDLRHTFCSRLVQKGVNLRVVQELAGHKSITMTARYAHLNTANLDDALALLNRAS
jgi:site-specific recombinase XerD